MARTSEVTDLSEPTTVGATVLPGMPLPTWGRPAEPVLPDPPPAPLPDPEPAPPALEMAMAGAPEAVAEATAPLDASPAPAFAAPPEAFADAPAPVDVHSSGYDGSFPDPLEEPVPALAPAEPAPTKAEVYAAAGAAPPTAPWGTPPAPLPVPVLDPPPAPTAAPLDLAPPMGEAVLGVADAPAPAAHAAPAGSDDGTSRSRRSVVLLGAAVGAVALGAVACFLWPGFLVSQDDASSAPLPRPAASAATVTLQAAPTVNGLTLVPGAPAGALSKAASGTNLAGYASPVTAVYGTGTTPKATVIAWSASTHSSPADVTTAFVGFQSATHQAVTAIAPAPTGTLGGQMSCGTSVVGATPASVCFWSDDATFGAVTVLAPATPTDGAATALALRAGMEHRG